MENTAAYLKQGKIEDYANHELNSKLENFYHRETVKFGFPESCVNIEKDKLDRLVLAYIENAYYKTGTGLFIQGDISSGKTSHLAYLAYHIVRSAGFYGVANHPEMSDCWSSPAKGTILYLNLMDILSNLSRPVDDRLVDFIKKATKIEYLFIDDIDRIEDRHALTRVENILERRCAKRMCSVITSSANTEALQANRYYERIIRIIYDSAQFIKLESSQGQVEIKFA